MIATIATNETTTPSAAATSTPTPTPTPTPTIPTPTTNVTNTKNKQRNIYWRNKPQTNAISGGCLIFLSGGMNLAQSLGWDQLYIDSKKHYHLCWFIGVILGCLLTILFNIKLSKKYCMFSSTLLILLDGIIFIWLPNSYNASITARYLNGLAIGITWPIFLLYTSEITVNSYRGICLAIEQFCITFGISIQIIFTSIWNNNDFNVNCLHGIFDILFAVLSFLCIYIWYIESPITYLLQHDELAALNCLACLEQPRGITNAKRMLLEEHKLYIKENFDYRYATMNFLKIVLGPLSKLLLLRSLILIFSFNLPLTLAFQWGTLLSIGLKSWPLILYAELRALGSLFAIITIDVIGRKIITIFCVLILGALFIGLAIILSDSSNVLNHHQMAILCTLSLLIQFFGGLFTPNSSAYVAEAFPLKFKFYLIIICIIIEQILQIIIIWTVKSTAEYTYVYFLTSGILCVLLFPIFYITIPETRKCSLVEAQKRFQNHINKKLW